MKSILTSLIAINALASIAPAQQDIPIDNLFENDPNQVLPRTEVATYMGVATSIVPTVLREHLGLDKGIGLKIDHVEPDSPADKAGVKPNDILVRLDDQHIINAHQLTILVRMKKAGDAVTLHLISQGKPTEVRVTLGQKELPVVEAPIGIMIPEDPRNNNPLPRTGEGRSSSVINHTDNEHGITINTHDDQRDITIKDKQGKLVYSGPLNTPEDFNKIPAELQKKVEMIQKAAGSIKDFRENRMDSINRGTNGSM